MSTQCSVERCPGTYRRGEVTHTLRRGSELVVVDHVPAKVCTVCRDVLLEAATVRELERLLEGSTRPSGAAAVYEFPKAVHG